MFVKDGRLRGDHSQDQRSLINRINFKKTAYIINDDKIEVEDDEED